MINSKITNTLSELCKLCKLCNVGASREQNENSFSIMPRRSPTSHIIAMLEQAENRIKIYFLLWRSAAQLRMLLQPLIFCKVGVFFLKKIDIFLDLFTLQNASQHKKTVAKFPIFPSLSQKKRKFFENFSYSSSTRYKWFEKIFFKIAEKTANALSGCCIFASVFKNCTTSFFTSNHCSNANYYKLQIKHNAIIYEIINENLH